MTDNEFYLDDDNEDSYNIDSVDSEGYESGDENEVGKENGEKVEAYNDGVHSLTRTEMELSLAYDTLNGAKKAVNSEKQNEFRLGVEDAVSILLGQIPFHNDSLTRSKIWGDLTNRQGHNRMINTLYTPDNYGSEDADDDYNYGEFDVRFNNEFKDEARELITRFFAYLVTLNESESSPAQLTRKRRLIPAFIIFLFNAGLYDLLINCETIPKVYSDQITIAFDKIQKAKIDIIEGLAKEYEKNGRIALANRVRSDKVDWFNNQPAELRKSYSDLDITVDDINTYRVYRNRWINTTSTITLDVISNYIKVVLDEKAGIYEVLKDKTRGEYITEVKRVWTEWVKENASDSELAKRIIWKDIPSDNE